MHNDSIKIILKAWAVALLMKKINNSKRKFNGNLKLIIPKV
ncbi:MAG TPA: hypothetical protein VEV87_06440 [Chitinophagaceae bacterium]|nr:hypothetical protein [Chitinophagaceae bacterium]